MFLLRRSTVRAFGLTSFSPSYQRITRLTSSPVPPLVRSSIRQEGQCFSSTQLGVAASERGVYSKATMNRLKGLDADTEVAKLATKLKTPRHVLQKKLSKSLDQLDQDSVDSSVREKAEYLDWLLTAFEDDNNNGIKKVAKKVDNNKSIKKIIETSKANPVVKATKTKKSFSTVAHKMPMEEDEGEQTFATNVQFAERTDLHPHSLRAITEVMGLTSMTEIQAKTFAAASSGRDTLGRARTGTGKTLAFLLPAIERLLQLTDFDHGHQVGILVVSPTRELASQIADQAETLLTFHRDMSVQVMFGGTNMQRDINQLKRRVPTILVATPGRLLDHMQSTKLGNERFGKDIMSQTPLLVLDETDRLLDMGFRREISKIMSFLPPSSYRQTLLFSATIPPELKTIMQQNMNKDFIEVDCINDGDAASHTNARVKQSHAIIPANSDRFVSSVMEIVSLAMEADSPEEPAKIVVFFTTARLVNFFAEMFNEARVLPISVMELHSKKTQSYRNRVSDEFRACKRGVLFTSDVSARGVDYPGVSHVIQFGMPESREQYIHRLGRTGRAGKEGNGWLVLSQWESLFLQELKGVEIPLDEEISQMMAVPISPDRDDVMQEIQRRVRGGDKVLAKSASGAYQAFLGYYLGQMKRMRMNRKEDLVDIANDFAAQTGLHEPPAMEPRLLGKMGLKGVAGLNVGNGKMHHGDTQQRRGGQGASHHGHSDGRRAPPKRKSDRRR